MALEDAIRELTEAVKEQTARLDKMLSGAPAASSSSKPAVAEKPAAKPAAAPKKPKEPTVDDVAAAAAAYLKTGDKKAKPNLTRICEHFGIDRLTNAKPENIAEILDMVKDFAAGNEPAALDSGADEDDEEDSPI